MHSTENKWFPTGVAKKTQFITAAIDSFDHLNSVESVKSKQVKHALRDTAKYVVSPTMQAAKSSKYQPRTKKKDSRKTSATLSAEFGRLFKQGKSLSQDEVKSSKTTTTSAVENLRNNAKIKK
jgi:hypothetical protein